MKRQFNRDLLEVKPLAERVNKLDITELAIDPATWPLELSSQANEDIAQTVEHIREAKAVEAPVIMTFGAHTIKNGLARVMTRLMKGGWIDHFATNGAGVIHDWEFAYQGRSGEDVHRYAMEGQFGIWQETGAWLNLAIIAGAYRGLGYGDSIGAMIEEQGIHLPNEQERSKVIVQGAAPDATEEELSRAAAAADLSGTIKHFGLESELLKNDGLLKIEHPFQEESLVWQAWKSGVPFTCHPMFGHDIIYTHPLNQGAAIGRCAQRDFLSFVDSVSRLEKGVYLSVGSAVMSPMIFEKALSMARNVARQQGKEILNFAIHVVDLAATTWDWTHCGEPPIDNPAYYHRFCKTFSRMGGRMSYCCADNRSWLVALLNALES